MIQPLTFNSKFEIVDIFWKEGRNQQMIKFCAKKVDTILKDTSRSRDWLSDEMFKKNLYPTKGASAYKSLCRDMKKGEISEIKLNGISRILNVDFAYLCADETISSAQDWKNYTKSIDDSVFDFLRMIGDTNQIEEFLKITNQNAMLPIFLTDEKYRVWYNVIAVCLFRIGRVIGCTTSPNEKNYFLDLSAIELNKDSQLKDVCNIFYKDLLQILLGDYLNSNSDEAWAFHIKEASRANLIRQ